MNLIGTREPSEIMIQPKTDVFPRQETSKDIGAQFVNQKKKIKFETSEAVTEAYVDEAAEDSGSGYGDDCPLIDFEDSTIHDEKLDLDELKRKYGY